MASPLHRHTRSGSVGMKKPQNTKAAAQRLAKMMAHQPADDEEEEDDLLYDFNNAAPTAGIGLAGGRQTRNRSPLSVRNSGARASPPVNLVEQSPVSSLRTTPGSRMSPAVTNSADQSPLSVRMPSFPRPSQSKPVEQPPAEVEQPPSARPVSSARASTAVNSSEQQPLSARSSPLLRPSQPKPVTPPSVHASVVGRSSFQSFDSAEEAQPPSARSNTPGRSPSYMSSAEQPSSARFGSLGRSNLRVKTASMVPPSVPLSVKPVASGIPPESQPEKNRDKRLSLDFGTFKYKESSGQQQSSSALQDELDMLQEENESLLEKLRLAEERCEEAESRTKQLEKQIASLGEGVSLEARLLSRKEADLQKREAALKVAAETYGGSREELAALRMEAEAARDEATSALEHLHEVACEAKSLRIITQRMILTQDEMEEVVLKRCWLARCWSLCVRNGIHAEIAGARHEYWSSFVSRPVEVILAAGRKAKDENSINNDLEEREKALLAGEQVTKKPNVESMLLVEKGLREMISLKVEEAIAISMAQKRRPSIIKTDELKLPIEGLNSPEAFELSQEECDDVVLKQAWLMYFWRRAKNQGLEPDIAEERLIYWINQGNKPPTSHDAVDVERGLMELRKLGIETKLWEESRRLIDTDSREKTLLETEYQMLA